MNTFGKTARISTALAGALLLSGAANGSLEDENVVLLWNSENAESTTIRNAYIAARPGVYDFDINTPYSTGTINNRYITPAKFDELFLANSPYQSWLQSHPDVYCVVTTLGLPGAISVNFSPNPTAQGGDFQPNGPGSEDGYLDANGISSSFESALAAGPSFTHRSAPPNPSPLMKNPYFGWGLTFDETLNLCDGDGPDGQTNLLAESKMMLVSRLDSGPISTDYDGDGDTDRLDGVLALIARSTDLEPINKYTISILFDERPMQSYLSGATDHGAALSLWSAGWPVLLDNTPLFIHGPNDDGDPSLPIPNPCIDPATPNIIYYDPSTDGPFSNEFQTLGLVTWGTNHTYLTGNNQCTYEPVAEDYAEQYKVHPAGIMGARESWGGWQIHGTPNSHPNGAPGQGQGQILDWIASGASFGWGSVHEPHGGNLLNIGRAMLAFYEHGLSWGESAFIAQEHFGNSTTCIGDPLAYATVYDPDLNGDRIIDNLDSILMDPQSLTGDINNDGVTDIEDAQILVDAWGRDNTVPPIANGSPFELDFGARNSCGDFNRDGVVDTSDLSIITQRYGQKCPLSDANSDAVVDTIEYSIWTQNYGALLGDINGDNSLDCDDYELLLAYSQSSDPYDASLDVNCDGTIDGTDFTWIRSFLCNNGTEQCLIYIEAIELELEIELCDN